MEKYTKEDIVNHINQCKNNQVTDAGRLYQIQLAMRADIDKEIVQAISAPAMTEKLIFQISGLAINGVPTEEIIKICQQPNRLEEIRDTYYQSLYGSDNNSNQNLKIIHEFQAVSQQHFDQISRQSETVSDQVRLIKEALDKKDTKLESMEQCLKCMKEQLEKGAGNNTNFKEQPDMQKKELFKNVKRLLKLPFYKLQVIFRNRKKDKESKKILSIVKDLDDEQAELVLAGYEQGLTIKDIKKYILPIMRAMLENNKKI